MCGVSAFLGREANASAAAAMVSVLHHRGPDDEGVYVDGQGRAVLGHDRLSILDLTTSGHQPMVSLDGRYALAFNGELYNYRELRAELPRHQFRSESDTEVVLAAWAKWGPDCLSRFLGMFAFVLWDAAAGEAHLVRDRFGVKPLYWADCGGGNVVVGSEIKAVHATGFPRRPDAAMWATYIGTGQHEIGDRTFWDGVRSVAPGSVITWKDGVTTSRRWYDVVAVVGSAVDDRPDNEVADEWLALAIESIDLRFRSDVKVGINLSGGVDSSFLLAAIQSANGLDPDLEAYTFVTGDPRYDELPWVQRLLAPTQHTAVEARLSAADVPELALDVARFQDEPYGGIPTLAYARLFEVARSRGTVVLLDGQGLDEQWAGYDYYRRAPSTAPVVQGSREPATLEQFLTLDARELAIHPRTEWPGDPLRGMQFRDLTATKLPRALRFNDRVSMRSSCELREPFLDHRLVELALRQPVARKVTGNTGKVFLRRMLSELLPGEVVHAPKRPLQTPQREWLRGPLAAWADEMIEAGLAGLGHDLLDADVARTAWSNFRHGEGDNSFFVWQLVSVGLVSVLN